MILIVWGGRVVVRDQRIVAAEGMEYWGRRDGMQWESLLLWVGGWAQLWLGGQYRSKLVLLQVEGSTVQISSWLRYAVPFPCHNGTAPYFTQVQMNNGTAPLAPPAPTRPPTNVATPSAFLPICPSPACTRPTERLCYDPPNTPTRSHYDQNLHPMSPPLQHKQNRDPRLLRCSRPT